jgi:DHA2 family multidrug resistance protein
MALLDIQIVASSLQDIGGGLSAAQDEISWVQTAYLIAEIIVIPLSGWLTRVFSTRWLFVASAAGFTATSLLCGLAWNIQSMIVFRALQGLLGASMVPTMFTSSFYFFQGPRRVYSAAVVGTIASIAPTLGPVIGGWITDTWNWHWLFYVNLAPGIVITVLSALLIKIDEPDLSLLKEADYLGITLMAVALGTPEYVLEEGSRWNWFDDATIRNCAWIAAIAGVSFVIRSLTFARPVVDLRALKNRNFAVGCFLSFVTGIGIFSTIYLTPLFLGYVRGFSAWQTGTAIFSTGAASLVGTPVYVLLARKFDTRWLMTFGLALFGVSMWAFSYITSDWSGSELLVPQLLRGFPQVFAVALDYVPRRVDDDCLQELRWLYDRRDLAEARRDLAAWLAKWSGKYSKLTGWVEENIDETLSFYRLPRQHHKHLKSTNMLERLNEEIRRRTHVVRIFPNGESCLRLVRALAVDPRELARAAPLSQHG